MTEQSVIKGGRMKTIICLLSILLTPLFAIADLSDSQQIMEKVNQIMCPETSKMTSKMQVKTSMGNDRIFESITYTMNGGEKTLIKYLSPVQVKDQTTLMLNNADDIWTYFPRTRRIRKLASHAKKQKIQGSDFSYEDMGSGNSWLEEFDSKLLKEEKINDKECYVLELIPNSKSHSHYSKMILFVSKDNYYPIKINYFQEDDNTLLEKTLTSENIVEIQGIPTAMKMTMVNQMDQSETIIETDEVEYNLELKEELFTQRGMKK